MEECRWLCNHFLEHRRDSWEWYGAGLSLYDQTGTLPALKKGRPSLDAVYSQTLQNVAVRIDLALLTLAKAGFRMPAEALLK